MADGGVWEGRRGERNVMALMAWKEEGLSSGDAARPSSAMAAMAGRALERLPSEVERGEARGSERGVKLWPGQRVAATRLRQGVHDAWSRGGTRMAATLTDVRRP
jgi:hypothetical protein